MLNIYKLFITLLCACLIYGCGGSGSGSNATETTAEPATFSAKLTGIEVIRKADNETVPVTSLPVQSAEITVSP